MSERRDKIEFETADEIAPAEESPVRRRRLAILTIVGVLITGFFIANLLGGSEAQSEDAAPVMSLPDDDRFEWTEFELDGSAIQVGDVVEVVDIVSMGDQTVMIVETANGTAVYRLEDQFWVEVTFFEELIPDVVHATRSEVFIGGHRILASGIDPVIIRGWGDSWVIDEVVGGGRVLWFSQEDGVTKATISNKTSPETQIAVQLPSQSPLRQPLYEGELETRLPDAIVTPDGIQVAFIPPHRLVPLRLPRVPVVLEYDFERGWQRSTFNDEIAQRDDTTVILPSQEELMDSNSELAQANPAVVPTGESEVALTENGFQHAGGDVTLYPGGDIPLGWDATNTAIAAIDPTRWPITPSRRIVVDALVELVSGDDGIRIEWNFLDTSGSVDPATLAARIRSPEDSDQSIITLRTSEANSPLYDGPLSHWNRLHTAISPAPAGVARLYDESGSWVTLRPQPVNDKYTVMDLDLIPGGGVVVIEGTWKDRPERIMTGLPRS